MEKDQDSVIKFPHFTPRARARWEQIPPWAQEKILAAVWCIECLGSGPMQLSEGHIKRGFLILKVTCKRCGHHLVRSVEPED